MNDEVPLSWKASDGSGEVDLLIEGGGQRLFPQAFSPDGARLLYEEWGNLGFVSLDGDRVPTLLWQSPEYEGEADLSPDGRWIAYEARRPGQYEVWVRPFPNVEDGGWQVSATGGRWPLWNPDGGRELFYIGPEGLMAVAVETGSGFRFGRPERLFDTAGYGTPITVGDNRRMDVAPDGQRFLMLKLDADRYDDAPDPVLVLNFVGELLRLVPTN